MVNAPRFATTLKEAAKPPLTKSVVIDKPFGLDQPVLLNHKVMETFQLSKIKHEIFSAEARERRQLKLDYELVHSPFYESKSFLNTNGKIFTPPISYFKPDKSKYFPDFTSKTLNGDETSMFDVLSRAKVSIVRLYSTMSGEKCVNSYFDVDGSNYAKNDFEKFRKNHPQSQMIDINIPSNWAKGFMINLSKLSIKKLISKERHALYFILPEHILQYDIRRKLHCDNMCSGYIYLIDQNGRLRWGTSGYSTEEELKLMWKCVRGLEKETSTGESAASA